MDKKYDIYGAFFSPTGGSKKALELLGCSLSEDFKYIDLTSSIERSKEFNFNKRDLLIVSAPVYAGRLPMVSGLFTNLKGNDTPCIVMAAYGNRHYDDTLAEMKKILKLQGFKVIGGIAPIIPHIYSNKLGENRPDPKDKEVILEFSEKVIKRLDNSQLEEVDLPGNENFEVLENKPGGKIEKTFDKSRCNDCGICIEGCPVQAINLDGEINKDECINCMKCVRVCKNDARGFIPTQIRKYLEENYLRRREVEYFI